MPTEQLYHRVPRPTASMEKVACFNQKIEDIVRRDGVGSFLKNASQDMLPTMIQEHREYASVLRRFVLTHGAKDPGVVSFLDDQNRPVVQYVRDLGARQRHIRGHHGVARSIARHGVAVATERWRCLCAGAGG